VLSPTWAQLKVGALLRGESDLRLYHNLFTKVAGEVGGLKRLLILCTGEAKAEPSDLEAPYSESSSNNIIIVFEGEKDHFRKLNGWNEFLHKEIRSITKDRWLRKADKLPNIPIGIHVRRGDFAKPKSIDDLYNRGAIQTPISWFIDSLTVIRDCVGPVEAFVVSDGNDEELMPLLAVKGVVRIETASAISDLLALSKAKILIASGGSSFSAWASFLGQMPTISHPGQSLTWFKLINRRGYYVGEFDPHSPPPQGFVDQLKSILQVGRKSNRAELAVAQGIHYQMDEKIT
jgi:Glycosyl transferase family 11